MATSQNGWPVLTTSRGLNKSPVPGTNIILVPGTKPGDVTTVLHYVASQFNKRVEKLVNPGCWGYAYREVRDGVAWSNHASATAMDLNAPKHPLGKSGTFTANQVAEIRKILNEVDNVVRWGGNYSGRKDEMHFEIIGNAALLAKISAKLKGGSNMFEKLPTLKLGSKSPAVRRLQHLLVAAGFPPDTFNPYTGGFGQRTLQAVKDFQKAKGLVDDGIVSTKTWLKLMGL